MERKTKIPALPRSGLPDAVPKHIDAESGEVEFYDDKYEKADVNSFKVLFYAVCVIASVTAGIALGFYLSSGMGDHPSPAPIKATTPKVKVDPPAMEMRAVPKEPVRKRAPSPKPKEDPLERKESPRADPVLSQTAVAAQQRLMDLKGNPQNHPNFRQGQQMCAQQRVSCASSQRCHAAFKPAMWQAACYSKKENCRRYTAHCERSMERMRKLRGPMSHWKDPADTVRPLARAHITPWTPKVQLNKAQAARSRARGGPGTGAKRPVVTHEVQLSQEQKWANALDELTAKPGSFDNWTWTDGSSGAKADSMWKHQAEGQAEGEEAPESEGQEEGDAGAEGAEDKDRDAGEVVTEADAEVAETGEEVSETGAEVTETGAEVTETGEEEADAGQEGPVASTGSEAEEDAGAAEIDAEEEETNGADEQQQTESAEGGGESAEEGE